MAHQPSSVDQKLREVLRQIQSEGRAEELLQVIQSSFGPFDVQGMSDASKRQRSDSEWDNAVVIPSSPASSRTPPTAGTVGSGYQAILPPGAQNAKKLPPGIRDVDHWGASLCELPKVKSRRLTYAELVVLSSQEYEIRTYLTRFILRHNGPSEKVQDFRRYLEFIGYPNHLEGPEPDVRSTYVFPRKFRG